MLKTFACLAALGALIAITPVPASAAVKGVQNSAPAVTHDEISARRYYYYRPYRYYRNNYSDYSDYSSSYYSYNYRPRYRYYNDYDY